MPKSLGEQLLRRLRRRPDEVDVPTAELPRPPAVEQLEQAVLAAGSGRAVDCERLALLLLAIDVSAATAEVATVAETLLGDAGPTLWRNLDVAARRSWWHAPAWAESARERVASGEAGILGVVVASFHPSGFVREAAAARLGELDNSVAVRALALRASDWVPQVRARARAALGHRLSSVPGLLAVGPLAVALAGRVQGRWLADRVEASMATLSDADLARLYASTDWRVRRAAYTIALAGHRLDVRQLLRAVRLDGDLVVRTRCSDAAIRAAAAAGDLAQVRPLIKSGTAAVRAAAVSALARAGDAATAIAALPDRNPVVREVAQAAVRRSGLDPAERYRELVMAGGPVDAGALAGLGETGTSADVDLIGPALMHPQPRARVEAVRALRRLAAIDVATLVATLQDPSPAVTRQAALSLRQAAAGVAVPDLQSLLTSEQAAHVRSAAYRVLREHDVWTRVLTDLELHDDENEDLRNRARSDLAGWLSRNAATTYSMPSGATADRLDELLTRHAGTLGRDREQLLRFHLGLTKNRGS